MTERDWVTTAGAAAAVLLGALGLFLGYPAIESREVALGVAVGLLVSGLAALGVRIRLLNGRNGERP